MNDMYKESDWKLFRKRIAVWQENYMDRLNREYIEILSQDKKAAEKFWELEKRIWHDKKHPGVVVDMRRSQMVWNVAILLQDGVIEAKDLEGFSEEMQEAVKIYAWGLGYEGKNTRNWE